MPVLEIKLRALRAEQVLYKTKQANKCKHCSRARPGQAFLMCLKVHSVTTEPLLVRS